MLVDTNIISELCRPNCNAGVADWAKNVQDWSISVITVEELYSGLAKRPNVRVGLWLENNLLNHCKVIEIDPTISQLSGELRGRLVKSGQNRTQADMLIAASALIHGITLVTRNEKDFSGTGVNIINPFS